MVGDVAFVDVDGWCEEDHLGGGGVQPVMQGDRALISGEVAVGHDGDVEPVKAPISSAGKFAAPWAFVVARRPSAVRVSASFSPSVTHSHAPVLAAR
ncbi:hypothetical protein N602_31700 [Mycobacterium avium subsp. hominissuis 10-5606]|nr:hypothetical protein N602_31700 [Mycobacterium avium subsp. hominissuis 10-5606]